jgi:threonine 3-dehydrogenase
MWALTYDRRREDWRCSTGMVKEQVPEPVLDGSLATEEEGGEVLIRVDYAGFCGSDRGIWWRRAFEDMVHDSLDHDGADRRTFGHELLGTVIGVGPGVTARYGYRPGDVVTTESHVVCDRCYQCVRGEKHVCANERIIGISLDGCFAEQVKLPAKSLWRTDTSRIRPEVGAVQEPFGNAVHACQQVDLRGKTVAILGTGTIGLFAVLVARAMGAWRVIGIEPDPVNAELARKLGCDEVIVPAAPPKDAPHRHDPGTVERILELTDGVGVDVAMEMAGFHSSLNNAIHVARRGGHVILFGVKNGDAIVEDLHRVVMKGLALHGVVGRRIFETWHVTRALLEHRANGIQDAVWETILRKGDDTLVDIRDWERASFEQRIQRHPKVLIRFAGRPGEL